MVSLAIAAIAWFAAHVGLAGTRLRDAVVARLGEGGFRIAFSLLSLAIFVAMVFAYQAAPFVFLWAVPAWLGWLLVLAMLPACILLVGAVSVPNPTAAGGERVTAVRGIVRVTRHPMLWSFAIWGIVHLIANGDLASLILFGTIAATALAGMPSIDAKLARRDPARWRGIAEATTIVPRLSRLREAGLVPLLGGVLLWVVLLGAHPHVIGVSPLPGGASLG